MLGIVNLRSSILVVLAACGLSLNTEASAVFSPPTIALGFQTHEKQKTMAFGKYLIDAPIAKIKGARSFSKAEQSGFEGTLGINFKGQKFFHVPNVEFAGRSWDVVLGVVSAKVFKVSALVELSTEVEVKHTWASATRLISSKLGSPSEGQGDVLAWNCSDGNVIVNKSSGFSNAVCVTLTSSIVRSLKRRE